ncbi:hypothetical protein K470DRAFT_260794, partial [Piedraia hortae CBS 480.64]
MPRIPKPTTTPRWKPLALPPEKQMGIIPSNKNIPLTHILHKVPLRKSPTLLLVTKSHAAELISPQIQTHLSHEATLRSSPIIAAVVDALPLTQHGCEGIGYLFPSEAIQPPQDKATPGRITFSITAKGCQPIPSHVKASLPLTETLFTTAMEHTLLSFLPYHPMAVWPSVEVGITVPDIPRTYLPLEKLTPWRTVTECWGNILRTVVVPDGGKEVPASLELEAEVQKRGGVEGGVWALIYPQKYLGTEHIDIKASSPFALSDDVKLVRVVSGGGGWGAKRGLLSLDPDPVHGEVVKPDDAISFYTAVERKGVCLEEGLRFGVAGEEGDQEVMEGGIRKGVFGALSEKGFIVCWEKKGKIPAWKKVDVPLATLTCSDSSEE